MKCPKCKDGELKVVNSYLAGDGAMTQKRVCDSCRVTATVIAYVACTNPEPGQGAFAQARRLRKASQAARAQEANKRGS